MGILSVFSSVYLYTQLHLSFTSSVVETVQALEHGLATILEWMKANRLKLKLDKMEIFCCGPSQIIWHETSLCILESFYGWD